MDQDVRRPASGKVAAEAHNVYIQALASGGLLLLTGYVLYMAGAVVRGVRAARTNPFARPLVIAALASAGLSLVENSLTDRLAYVPLALIAALPLAQRPALAADEPAADSVVEQPAVALR